MKQIETEIIIEAPVEHVWENLMNFKEYPNWNPFIKSIKGTRTVGKKLQIKLQSPSGKEFSFEPIVLINKEFDEFRWRGKFGLRGIFDGEHYFALEKIDEHHTRFIHGEFFSGILVGLLNGTIKETKKGFEMMNEALKLISETK